jgi:hypothetical protein
VLVEIAARDEIRNAIHAIAESIGDPALTFNSAEDSLAIARDYLDKISNQPDRSDSEIRAAKDRVARLESYVDRWRVYARHARRIAELRSVSEAPVMPAAKLESIVAGGAELEEVERKFHLKAGESKSDALHRVRARMTELRAERRTVKAAPLPLADVRRHAKEQIARLAARGQPKVLMAFNGGSIEFPEAETYDPGPTRHYVGDGVALIAALFQEELFAKVDEALKFNADDDNALTEAKREERLAAIDEELDALGREEAALVEAIVRDGGTAYHRPQANPLHVLGLRVTG